VADIETPGAVGEPAYLGVDLGTQGVRAAVVAPSGDVLGSGSAPLSGTRIGAGRHEQDPASWWSAAVVAIRAALATVHSGRLAGLAIDSTSGTILVQDAHGRPRGPALMYDDERATEQADTVRTEGAELWERLGYRVPASWALPKLLWLLEHTGLSTGDTVVHQADHVAARLAGHPVATDTSHALKTGYDLLELCWPRGLHDRLGIPDGLLPGVVLPGTVLGEVCGPAAAETGIPAGTPIAAGMTDGCAAQIAARALTPGSWSSTLGTTLVIKGCTPDLVRDPHGAVYCHRGPDGGWLPGGASSTGARVIAEEFAGADLDLLSERAARLGVIDGVCYPLAGRGERFPFVAPEATGFSEGVPGDPASRFGAILQGVAFLERLCFERLAALGADTTGPVMFSGGGSRNPQWNQLRADVLGRTVRLPEAVEAAVGSAVLAAASPGEVGATAERMVRIGGTLVPAGDRSRLDEGYQRFLAALVKRGWLGEMPEGVGTR
jgi:sugar (pentulose or hexulose) kinase